MENILEQHSITLKYYKTEQNLHNYFIFIEQKVAAKGSTPQVEFQEAKRLAIEHSLLLISDHLLTPKIN